MVFIGFVHFYTINAKNGAHIALCEQHLQNQLRDLPFSTLYHTSEITDHLVSSIFPQISPNNLYVHFLAA